MPEGDTIFRAARTLHRALSGAIVTRFETGLASLSVEPLIGRTMVSVESRGKHLLMRFSGGLILRTHMRMRGSWHLYRPGERWRQPAADARIVIVTADWVAIAFRVAEAEFVDEHALAHHPRLSALGPDLLNDTVDVVEAVRRLRSAADLSIGRALLTQTLVAGIGNVYKSEVLFICRVHPLRPVAEVPDEMLVRLLETARRLLRVNVHEHAGASGHGRRTSGRLNPNERVYVYDRAGRPCYRCATAIASARDDDGRRTYWCPQCQAL